MSVKNVINLKETIQFPDIPGLNFRGFRGETDFSGMVAVRDACKEIDGMERVWTIEDYVRMFQHLVNCDPYQDMLFAEVDGRIIAFSRVWWDRESDDRLICHLFHMILPEWRRDGIPQVFLAWNETRLREIAAGQQEGAGKLFRLWVGQKQQDLAGLLEKNGYKPVRYFFQMVRPNLENIPDLPMPEGLETRIPATREEYRKVFKALEEVFQDHWGATSWKDEWFEAWLIEPTFDPTIWQVAYDGDEVVGTVMTFIDERENLEFNRKRGYTEDITVKRQYRRRGLAKTLISRSLKVLKERGLEEAALGVDADNANGALGLYESMGYVQVKRDMVLEKALQ
ncbi:MAG: GNAT family N-acetyltransferase [Anaerolineales bacterium]|nr:GNAT family N-acetyltransferase [Anaerolineales bacterium]